jgi:hypothetical protein
MRIPRALGAAIALLAALPATAAAQQAGGSPHGTLSANTDCTACHTQRSWRPARARPDFDHNEATAFALLGRHEKASCTACHLDLRFDTPKLSVADCASCHVDVHQGRFVAGCPACHNTTAFTDVSGMTLHSRTSFPLSGAHLQISCESCHLDDAAGAYTSLDSDCGGCHAQDYAAAGSIDHVALEFPTDCELCHGNIAWRAGAAFDHVTTSRGFALVGAHARLDCSGCHALPGMQLVVAAPSGQNDCVACHEADYGREHAADRFPVTCLDCHSVDTWFGVRIDHVAIGFPLLGAHAALDCSSCHSQPGYGLLFPAPSDPNDCVACHQSDYDREHTGTGFPATCLDCHTVNDWSGASFNHSQWFPIASGPHANAGACETCHVQPGNFQVFSCFNCHQHSRDRMDDKHRGRSGYVYESNACYSCHPNGRGD